MWSAASSRCCQACRWARISSGRILRAARHVRYGISCAAAASFAPRRSFPERSGQRRPVQLLEVRDAPNFESGGGGLVSTAGDYARFLQMLLNGGSIDGRRFLSRKTIELMTADHLGPIDRGARICCSRDTALGLGLPFACKPASRMFRVRSASTSGAALPAPRFGSIPRSSFSPCCSSRRLASATTTARCIATCVYALSTIEPRLRARAGRPRRQRVTFLPPWLG